MIRNVKVLEKQRDYVLVTNNTGSIPEVRDKTYKVTNPHNLPVAANDIVEIHLPTGRTVLFLFATFVIPLIMFPLGYWVARQLLPGDGRTSEAIGFLAGLALLLIGIPLLRFLRATSEIIRITDPQQSCPIKNINECSHGCCAACEPH